MDNTPLSYFQWNYWHYQHKVNVSYEVEPDEMKKSNKDLYDASNYTDDQAWLNVTNNLGLATNSFKHWNCRISSYYNANDSCKDFSISQNIGKLQPSPNKHHNCVASVLGDLRHSDWIKV